MAEFAGDRGLPLNGMKKIAGAIMGAGLLSIMAHTAFAELLSGTSSETSDTRTAVTSVAPVTTETTGTTSEAPAATRAVDSVGATSDATTATPLVAHVSLEGNGALVSGTKNVFIKVSRSALSVEVRLTRNDAPELYLGQAQFDAASEHWVFAWDSTRTPDGPYRVFAIATTADGVNTHSNAAGAVVRNEKEGSGGGELSGKTSQPAAERFIAEVQKVKQSEGERIVRELSMTLKQSATQKESAQSVPEAPVGSRTEERGFTARPRKTAPADIEKVIDKQSQDLKDAIDNGDIKKKAEIMSEIVRTVAGAPAGSPAPANPELNKKVEESVAKLERVATEQKQGIVDDKIFKVEKVEVAQVTTKSDGTKTASKIAFHGKALPNSFVTLYIYSIPILVTVKTDAEGNWNYTLDKELDNGKHQVYVGITDVKGNVVVKSNPLPFVKTASAITVEQALAVPEVQAAPNFVENNYFYGVVTVIILVVAIVLIIMGIRISRRTNQ